MQERPRTADYQGHILGLCQLSYLHHWKNVVGMAGFDPAASCSPSRRAAWLRYIPRDCGLGDRSRTCDPRVPNAVRYQLRYTEVNLVVLWSAWCDSNARSPRPERGGLTGLSYTPCVSW